MTHTINLSDGSSYSAELVVYRDFIESNGQWRLFWQNPGTSCGVHEQSTVTGRPFFHTMRDAIAHGERLHQIRAIRGHGFAGDIGVRNAMTDRLAIAGIEIGSTVSSHDCNDFQRCHACKWGFWIYYYHPRPKVQCPRCGSVQEVSR